MWKQIAIAFSFANLCYLRVWSELLTYTPAQTYEMRLPPQPLDYLAVSLNVVLWGGLLSLGALWLRRGNSGLQRGNRPLRRALEWMFLLLLLVPLNALRAVLAGRLPVGQHYLNGGAYAAIGPLGLTLCGTALAAGGAFALHRFRAGIFRAARAAVLLLAPLAPLTLLQAGWKAWRYDSRPFLDQPAAPRLGTAAQQARRVVWVIFDEWDERLTFEDRLAGLELPEIDRFREQAFAARNAYPPAANTLQSMPGLITGKVVERAVPRGSSDLELGFAGDEAMVSWRDAPNVFGRARALGFDTALAGVYHPYCRVLESSLTSCSWWEVPRPINSTGETLAARMRGQTRSLFETWRLSLFGQALSGERKAREFPAMLERARTLAADPAYGLVLIHLLTPHFPYVYDRASGGLTLGNAPLRGYYDSLALTDRVLAELRGAMERRGVWETTTVLLSSDHALRHAAELDGRSDQRVPFLLKLARQRQGMSYEGEFNSVVSADLLLDVLQGRLAAAGDVARWLDGRGRSGTPLRATAGEPYGGTTGAGRSRK